MPAVRTPEASRPTRHIAVPRCSLPRRGIGSATSITFDFGAIYPFTCVPACNLPVYASQWLTPRKTRYAAAWLRLCRHPRRLNSTRLQGATPSEPDMTIARHPAQASAVGKRSPAARSIRSWFRLTGGFRHPSFGLFSLRRLTSPSVEAANLIAPLRPAGSLHPFRLGIPAVAALSAPLQDGLRFLRHPLPPPLWPFLAVGFPPCGGTDGAYPVARWGVQPGRLRPVIRREFSSPLPAHGSGNPTRVPFGSGHQPLGPVLYHGLYRTFAHAQPSGLR
jgi:hypothetical protein